jgi:hypothetical protein
MGAYDYEIEWIRGENNIADPGSRLCQNVRDFESKVYISAVIGTLSSKPIEPFGAVSLDTMQSATCNDMTLKRVLKALSTDNWGSGLERFGKIKEELRATDGLVTKLGAIVVPEALRTTGTKSILRERVWWPGMATEAETWVKNCLGCALASKGERPVPMKATTLPEGPWQKLAADFNGPHAAYGGRSVFVLVDCYSRFVVPEFVKSTDMGNVRPFLEKTFHLLGNPRHY